ncbi:MAG: hypothetical protein JWR69_1571 [Pedosphaera sp.]|nr:hypothetical protein [Pedosphaera sp.]
MAAPKTDLESNEHDNFSEEKSVHHRFSCPEYALSRIRKTPAPDPFESNSLLPPPKPLIHS